MQEMDIEPTDGKYPEQTNKHCRKGNFTDYVTIRAKTIFSKFTFQVFAKFEK